MNIKKFQLMLRSKGIRIGDDDPMFLLLSENEKILKEFIRDIQESYAININTQQSKEAAARHNQAVISAAMLIVTIFLIVVAFWLGQVWGNIHSQIFIGFGFGLIVGLVITVAAINISVEPNKE